MRLTPEREKELREESKKSYPYEPTLQWGLQEVFEEIDALREEKRKLRHALTMYVLGDENGALDDGGELGRNALDGIQ